jgi:DNA-binding NarL/FixJ family response regulator
VAADFEAGHFVIRVLCVDDHAIVRQGLAALLGCHDDIEIVGAAASGEEAVALFERQRPDITLMDLQLPIMSGLEAIKAIRRDSADALIIVLTMYQGADDVYSALQAGATTYLVKDTLSDDLVRVIREVHSGLRPVPPDIQARLTERAQQPALTHREVQVLDLIARGMRNKEISTLLGIADETTHAHVKNIFAKLSVTDRTAAVHVALKRGIIHIA